MMLAQGLARDPTVPFQLVCFGALSHSVCDTAQWRVPDEEHEYLVFRAFLLCLVKTFCHIQSIFGVEYLLFCLLVVMFCLISNSMVPYPITLRGFIGYLRS